ncbi:uncharacterized protein MYCFIDRAFT_212727 [Pseudocercospora fijiensis CIRAD86]|uniref:Uncharacterized protein n=1 Tax=Pseudocercospora fijiensis (strain CIRAD86) TaxID=383855 RepID=M3AIH8_PSEFD|nr:uncharacterized protein MYCFIDRAFT_212727 [Pseudocercospora fijiensis CIRAD86]EME77013.1 hypothetical protein MYCFIDRAFT_212727 [Pseudocercospora fijiensis CIRAD86]
MSSSTSRSRSRKRSRPGTSTVPTVSSQPTSALSEKASTYDDGTLNVLRDCCIYGPPFATGVEPSNKAELLAGLQRRRSSLDASAYPDSNFKRFLKANYEALNESQVMLEVVYPYFTTYFKDHPKSANLAFTNLEPIFQPPPKISPPQPDHSFGTAEEDIHLAVRNKLDKFIVCSRKPHAPAAVNDMMQVKGREGKARVLDTQITKDGAIGERAMYELHGFARGSPCPADGVAHTFLQSYHDGVMKFFVAFRKASSVRREPDKIYITEIAGEYLCGSPEHLRKGLTMYRNFVDMATEARSKAVEAANAVALASEDEGEGEGEENEEFHDAPAAA